MSKRHHKRYERRERDFYATPLVSLRPLIPYLRAARVTVFAEPCCGEGDLTRALESFGLRCVYQGDIKDGMDALAISRFDAPVITNTPYLRVLMMPLIEHFIATAPCSWLLLLADFAHVLYARQVMRHCTDVVPVGRIKWFGGGGFENLCWYRFSACYDGAPILHNISGDLEAKHTMRCDTCGQVFRRLRSDMLYCSPACRQRAYRMRRLSVTEP